MTKFKKIFLAIIAVLVIAIGFNFADVLALINYGTGDECLTLDFDLNDFPVSRVLVDDVEWVKNGEQVFHSTDNSYIIKVYAGRKILEGEEYPYISTAGGMDDYKKYYSMENPNEDPNVVGDEYILTLILHDYPYDKNTSCLSMGFTIQNGPLEPYQERVDTNVTISITGDELEYHYVEDKPNEADVSFFKFGINSGHSEDIVPFTFGNANYTYNSNPAPHNVSSVSTKQAIPYSYDYDGSGFVTFYINGGGTEYYKSIIINGHNYSLQVPSTQVQVFEHLNGEGAIIYEIHDVEYNSEGYNVVVVGEQYDEELTVAGFGWSYLSSDISLDVTSENEGNFAHGRLEFVQAKYTDIDGVDHVFNNVNEYNAARYHGTGQIYAWHDGLKQYIEEDRRTAWGEARVPYGTELTVKVVPDPGYQLVSFSTSENGFQATSTPGVYKIVLTRSNFSYNSENRSFDLSPVFEKIDNEVRTNSEKITSGSIDTNQNVDNGTIKLEVSDINVSGDSRNGFESKANETGFSINSFLDLSLFNTIYKGGKKDNKNNYLSWDTEINHLTSNASISLVIDEDLSGKEVAVIHEEHDQNNTVYNIIEAAYNAETSTIEFGTSSFSNYAIIVKGESNSNDPVATYLVNFDSRGGSQVDSIEVNEGDKVVKPNDPSNGNLVFAGWYLDEECNNPFDFNTEIHDNYNLFAKWEEVPQKYTVETNDDSMVISFSEESGHTFRLELIDFANVTSEDLANIGLTQEEYDAGKAMFEDVVKDLGEILAIYEINVCDEMDACIHEGPFTIMIKMTDAMKKFNTFRLTYVEDDFSTEEPIELKVENGYLVGTLEHLSNYALTGSYVKPAPTNPLTGDNIYIWTGMLFISVIGLSIGTITVIKRKKQNV